jgi:hypothetical protein
MPQLGYGNGTVVAESRVSGKSGYMVGPPGGPWEFHAADTEVVVLMFGNGAFHATLEGGSGNGVPSDVPMRGAWETRGNLPNREYWDIGYSSGTFVIVGSRDGGPLVVTSSDGLNWQEIAL